MKSAILIVYTFLGLSACHQRQVDPQHPNLLWSNACDEFDKKSVPPREKPYLIEGEWDERKMYYHDGTTNIDGVRWLIYDESLSPDETEKVLEADEPTMFFTYFRDRRICVTNMRVIEDRFHMVVNHGDYEDVSVKTTPENLDWVLRHRSPEVIKHIQQQAAKLNFPLFQNELIESIPELNFSRDGMLEIIDGENWYIWYKWQGRFEVRFRTTGPESALQIQDIIFDGPFYGDGVHSVD